MRPDGIAPGWSWRHLVVDREIGAGAFGVVWLARDTLIARPVALKVMTSPDAERADALLSEARALGQVVSPNVVVLYGVHRYDPTTVLLEMEYVDGGTLEDVLGDERRLPAGRAVALARGIAAGLTAVHVRHFVHGDVKPANVLLTREGVPKLADFGLARLRDEPGAASEAGSLRGTPQFMAPEVALGEAATPASDVWSLGVMLHRMLSGTFPFRGMGIAPLFHAIQNEEPSPALGPEVPPALARTVRRCLAKRPGDRYVSGGELAEDLRRIADPGLAARPAAAAEEALLGREAERAAVTRAIESASAGVGGALLVLGPQGAGKSALLRHASERARAGGFRTVDVVVTPVAGLVGPLLERVREAAGDAGAGSCPAPPPTDPVEALRSLAAAGPLAVLVDGAEHAEPAEARLLRDLVRRLLPGPVFLAVAARAGEASSGPFPDPTDLTTMERVVRVDMGPLAAPDLHLLLDRCADGKRVDPEVAERVIALSDGNPLRASEILRHLLATEAVAVAGATVVPGERWATADVPKRLRELVAHRLRRETTAVRDVLDAAAVAGVEFTGDEVAAVLSRPVIAVLRPFQRLCRTPAILAPTASGYRFASALSQEVLYEDVAPELRREIHRRLAVFHEGHDPAAQPERLGRHWERAGRPDKAAGPLLEAAVAAAKRQEFRRTIDLAARAGLDPARFDGRAARLVPDAAIALASALSNAGRAAEAERVLEALAKVAAETSDAALAARVRVRQGYLAHTFGRIQPADEEAIRTVAASMAPSAELGWARLLLASVALHRGDPATAEALLREAEATFASVGFQAGRVSALARLGEVAGRTGRHAEAAAHYEDAARLSVAEGMVVNAATADVNRIVVAFQAGDVAGHEARLAAAARTLAVEGAKNLAAHATILLGHILFAQGDLAGARRRADEALPIVEAARYAFGLAAGRLLAGTLETAAGRPAEALRSFAAVRRVAEESGDLQSRALSWALEAQGHAIAGGKAAALAAAESAVASAAGAGDPDLRTGVAMALVEAAAYGLPLADVRGAGVLLPPAEDPIRERVLSPARAALAGAEAYARPDGGARALREAAKVLAGPAPTDRRAALRVVGLLFDAEASRREGAAADATAGLRAALERAARIGHVALETAVLERLEAVDPAGPWGARRRANLPAPGVSRPGSPAAGA